MLVNATDPAAHAALRRDIIPRPAEPVRTLPAKGETPTPATPEAKARTRAFARVIGPVPRHRADDHRGAGADLGTIAAAFFANDALVWIAGGLLLFSGPSIIGRRQYRSSPAASLISLYGWFLAPRGLTLLAAPLRPT